VRRGIIRALILLAVLAAVVVLFLRTVEQTVTEPYLVRSDLIRSWTVTVEGPADPLGAIVSLRPPAELPMQVSQQVFRRHTESMMAPAVRSVPLVLRHEFDLALSGVVSPDELAALAREVDVGADLEPVCLAVRRRDARDPGRIFFLHFESSRFARFRALVAETVRERGGLADHFDPHALSPLLVVASSDRTFDTWLPRRADASECLAPITIEDGP
jgi:hypothetical protein